jgi:hypothetical protein
MKIKYDSDYETVTEDEDPDFPNLVKKKTKKKV